MENMKINTFFHASVKMNNSLRILLHFFLNIKRKIFFFIFLTFQNDIKPKNNTALTQERTITILHQNCTTFDKKKF